MKHITQNLKDAGERYIIYRHSNWRSWTNTLPAGSTPLGSITRADGTTGALVYFSNTGQYAQVSAGVLRTLDQREVVREMERGEK